MSWFMRDIRRAVREDRLAQPFRASDVERACPGWGRRTYRVFLGKHRVGNPGAYTAYFVRVEPGLYRLLER